MTASASLALAAGLLGSACAAGAYQPVARPAAGLVRPKELRVEQRPLDPNESIDMHLVVEVDPTKALVAGARLQRTDAPACAGGTAPTRIEVRPKDREATLDFRCEDLAASKLLEEPTALDLTVVEPGAPPRCLRVLVLDEDPSWTRERSRGFGGLAIRFMGVLEPVDGERLMRIDLEFGHGGRRVGWLRLGVEVFMSALIHGEADPLGGYLGDVEMKTLWGAAPFVHVPLLRFKRIAIGPELAYELTAGWTAPHVYHGPRAGLRFNILAPPFHRRGFRGPPEDVSFAVQLTAGLFAVEAELPTTPTIGVGIVVESF